MGQEGPNPRVVVGDFGCVITTSDIEFGMEHPRMQQFGTPEWYPPEGRKIERNTRYGTETDIWQAGATIHTMSRLLPSPDHRALGRRNGNACESAYGRRLNGVVDWCTHADYRKRPSAATIVKELIKVAKDKKLPAQTWMVG